MTPPAGAARAVSFESGGVMLVGSLLAPERPRAALLLCHGMPSEHPRDPADPGYEGLARTVAERGYAGFWFDFRGARGAPGEFSIAGWVADATAAVDAVGRTRGLEDAPVVLAGSSAGGAVCIAAAARRKDVAAVAALAAPATFRLTGERPEAAVARLRNLGLIRDPNYPRDVAAWAAEFEAEAAEAHVAAVSPRPLLIVHGDADDVVPYVHAERLYAAAEPPKELARIPGGPHQLRRDARAVDCLLDWLDRLPF